VVINSHSCTMWQRQSQKSRKLVRFKQKGQKQASFLAFHKCCQGCLLRGPRYISTRAITRFEYLNKTCKTVVKSAPNSVKKMSKTLLRHTSIKKIFLTFLLTPYLYTFSHHFFRNGCTKSGSLRFSQFSGC
jgi:hypothetical protein